MSGKHITGTRNHCELNHPEQNRSQLPAWTVLALIRCAACYHTNNCQQRR